MSEVPYNYTISTAFDQGLNITLLQSQVVAAALSQTLLRIDTIDDTLTFVFGGTLSAPNQTTLNNVVANHIGYANTDNSLTGATNGYIMDVHNTVATGGGYGLRILAGEMPGDIAFHIADQDDTFKIMEMEADVGYVTLGKTYAQTLLDNGVVYGFDIQHNSAASDFNTQNGVYRIGGTNVVDVAQTLTNKTITATNNNVSARGLITATTTVNVGSATAPTAGQVLTATNSTTATWQAPPFSSYFQQDSSDGMSNTTSTSYQQKLRITTSNLTSGTYRIGWMYEWSFNSTSRSFEARVRLGTTTIMEHAEEPQDTATSQWREVGGFYYATSLSGINNIDIDYASSSNSATSRIRRARLEIWRVA